MKLLLCFFLVEILHKIYLFHDVCTFIVVGVCAVWEHWYYFHVDVAVVKLINLLTNTVHLCFIACVLSLQIHDVRIGSLSQQKLDSFDVLISNHD
jgi:hypothetical protein